MQHAPLTHATRLIVELARLGTLLTQWWWVCGQTCCRRPREPLWSVVVQVRRLEQQLNLPPIYSAFCMRPRRPQHIRHAAAQERHAASNARRRYTTQSTLHNHEPMLSVRDLAAAQLTHTHRHAGACTHAPPCLVAPHVCAEKSKRLCELVDVQITAASRHHIVLHWDSIVPFGPHRRAARRHGSKYPEYPERPKFQRASPPVCVDLAEVLNQEPFLSLR